MQTGNADRSGEFENNRYKEAGNIISICMPPCMGKIIAAVFLNIRMYRKAGHSLCLSAVSVKGFLSWFLLSALLLQLSEPVSHTLPFGWSWWSVLLFHLTLPVRRVTVILFYNSFRFPIGRHECLYIGITVLPENIGELIQPFRYFLFGLLYLLGKSLAFLTFENAICFGKLLFQLGDFLLQAADCPRLVLYPYHQISHSAELCHIDTERWLRRHLVFTDKVL